MKAVQISQYGGYEQLRIAELPQPEAAEGQVVVKMATASINILDNLMRLGRFPAPLPLIPGNEGAGVVSASTVPTFPIGTRVMFKNAYRLPHGGTWQEYVLTTPHTLAVLPENKSFLEAAALRSSYEAAYTALVTLADFEAGQVVLAPGVGGGIGNATVQLALALGAKRVLTTASTKEKAEKAYALGIKDVIDLTQESLRDGVERLTEKAGVDVVIDGLGGNITKDCMAVLKPGKTHVLLGDSTNADAHFNISRDFLLKGTRLVGYRNMDISIEVRAQAFAAYFALWQEGKIKPLVAKVFPIEQVAEAHRFLIDGQNFGKVLLAF